MESRHVLLSYLYSTLWFKPCLMNTLPGEKALQSSDKVIQILLLYATEQRIERRKKDQAGIIAAKRSDLPRERS